jgi:hypothetical protein
LCWIFAGEGEEEGEEEEDECEDDKENKSEPELMFGLLANKLFFRTVAVAYCKQGPNRIL